MAFRKKLPNKERSELYNNLRTIGLPRHQALRLRDWSNNHIKQWLETRLKVYDNPNKWHIFKKH